jgi:RNA-directed DNA polymerase
MIIEQMASRLALSTPYLMKLASSASHRYKRYEIPKRTGGMRTIHHPAREIKLIQRWLLRNVLISLPVHPAATAYQQNCTIKRNAELHAVNNYLLRVDFQEFFPSLRGADVNHVLIANRQRLAEEQVTDQDIEFIKRIVCRLDALTIGAPTSPLLSNAIMFDFDATWRRNAEAAGVIYTRYADDLYFSTNEPDILSGLLTSLREYLKRAVRPNLQINEAKTAFSSRKWRKLATGLVLTHDRKVSLGRHKKRMLKALVWRLTRHELSALEIAHLRGWISYAVSVEPDFVARLQRKYALDFRLDETWQV